MFNQENLTKMFEGKEFGYGKWLIYFYAKDYDNESYAHEEVDCDVEVLDGVLKITTYTQKEETHERDELEGEDYFPFENIIRISFVPDF